MRIVLIKHPVRIGVLEFKLKIIIKIKMSIYYNETVRIKKG